MTHTISRGRLRRSAITMLALAVLLLFAWQPATSTVASTLKTSGPWSLVPGATSPANSSYVLQAVATVSVSDVWAVGFQFGSDAGCDFLSPLTEHWNGTKWSVVPTPGQSGDSLNAVTVLTANDVWAVGSTRSGPGTFTDHWNGTTWTVVPGPGNATLMDVASLPGGTLWAVSDDFGVNSIILRNTTG